MKGERAVVGVFEYLDDTLSAINFAKEQEFSYRVFSPCASHEIEQAASPERSPVRFLTFAGALFGLIGGFALAIWCSLDWPLRTSAKTIVSIPAFAVIGYECTILFGALATLGGVFHFCRLPDVLRKVGYDSRFSKDRFGVVVGCSANEADEIRARLEGLGAEQVEVRDGL